LLKLTSNIFVVGFGSLPENIPVEIEAMFELA